MGVEPLAATAIVAILLLGGWVAVDGTGFGQFMVSRPFVAATLAGWIAGDPRSGAEVGLLLEAFHLSVLPVGAARFPESGPPAVAAGAAYAASEASPAVLVTALVFALAWEWVAGATVRSMRLANVHILGVHSATAADSMQRRHLLAIGVDFLRGVVLAGVGLGVLVSLIPLTREGWLLEVAGTRTVTGVLLVGLLATSARIFGSRVRLFAAGAAAAAGLLVLLR
jgi:mannose/fructose/N-acetylgalactosamine-specific phosphotransferase system component IIC